MVRTNSNCSRLACVPVAIAINKTNYALLLLWQNVCANDAGSRPLLLDTIMAYLALNQPTVDFFCLKYFQRIAKR